MASGRRWSNAFSRPASGARPEQRPASRFRREAETVAQLSHPNIVPLHFIGQKDDLLYLAMACIDGGSVADRLGKEGPLPIRDVER